MATAKPKGTNRKPPASAKAEVQISVAGQSRINIRLAPAVKDRVARAAALNGQDLTEFAVATLSEKADLIIERHDNLLLGSEEHEFFLNALAEPIIQEPSERSRSAAEKYRQGSRKGVRYTLAD
jgi:uncharacterized protein (DUF1778 family)